MLETAVSHDHVRAARALAPDVLRPHGEKPERRRAGALPRAVLDRHVAAVDERARRRIRERAVPQEDVVRAIGAVRENEGVIRLLRRRAVHHIAVFRHLHDVPAPVRRREVGVQKFDLIPRFGTEEPGAAVVDDPQTAVTAFHGDRRAVVEVAAVIRVETDAVVHHLAETARLGDMIRVGRRTDDTRRADGRRDRAVLYAPETLPTPHLKRHAARGEDIDARKRQMAVGIHHDGVVAVVAVQQAVGTAHIELHGLIGPAVEEHPETLRRKPFALKSHAAETKIHEKMPRAVPEAREGRVHRLADENRHAPRISGVPFRQIEVDERTSSSVDGDDDGAAGQRFTRPVPVDIEVLQPRARAVPHRHTAAIRLDLPLRHLRRRARRRTPEDECRTLAVQREIRQPLQFEAGFVTAEIGAALQFDARRPDALRFGDRAADGGRIAGVRNRKAEVLGTDTHWDNERPRPLNTLQLPRPLDRELRTARRLASNRQAPAANHQPPATNH